MAPGSGEVLIELCVWGARPQRKILDLGRILQTKELFFLGYLISMEDLFLPVIFLDVSFAIWNPDFWSVLSWPTVGFLVALSQHVFFSQEIFNVFLYSKIVWFRDNFLRKNGYKVPGVAVLHIHTVVSVFR